MSTQLNEMISESISPEQKREYDLEFMVWGEYGDELLGARPFEMTEESLKDLFDLHSKHDSFFTDFTDTSFERFYGFMLGCAQLPTEVVVLPEKKHVGFMYLTDSVVNELDPTQIVTAFGHFSFWEGKLGRRRDLVNDVIELIAKGYRMHRLSVRLPAYARGAIRAAIKLGFTGDFEYLLADRPVKVEALLRDAVLYQGEWRDVIIMSKVGEELWASHPK